MDFVRLWLHEASRVYGDKLVDEKDIAMFEKIKFDIAKQTFEVCKRIYLNQLIKKCSQDLDDETLRTEPLIYCHFAAGIGEPKYLSIPSWPHLSKILEEALDSYNEINAVMNLVLFEDAMQHV